MCVYICVFIYDIYMHVYIYIIHTYILCSKNHCQASEAGYIRASINYLNMISLKCPFSNHDILTL